jgi:type II secretory pathway pseudopilin PulG
MRRRAATARVATRVAAFTLLETLLALAIAGVVIALLGGALAGGMRTAGRIADGAAQAQRRALAWSLLRQELERAGRRVDEAGLVLDLDPADGGGDRVLVRYLADAYRAEPVRIEAWFFAAEDGGGRPNLYRRPPDAVRQPWLLGVTGLRVVRGRADDGRPLARSELVPGARVAAIELEVRFEDGERRRGWTSVARAGPLG